jgi:hypothetical protein
MDFGLAAGSAGRSDVKSFAPVSPLFRMTKELWLDGAAGTALSRKFPLLERRSEVGHPPRESHPSKIAKGGTASLFLYKF